MTYKLGMLCKPNGMLFPKAVEAMFASPHIYEWNRMSLSASRLAVAKLFTELFASLYIP
jgi:hypothetical protein